MHRVFYEKKSITYCLRIVSLSFLSSGIQSSSAACITSFSKQEEQILTLAIKAEELLQIVYTQTYETNETISTLSRQIADIISSWEATQQPLSFNKLMTLKRKVKILNELITDLQKTQEQDTLTPKDTPKDIPKGIPQKSSPEWVDLIEDPTLIKPYTPYQVKWPNNQEATIVFNKQIIDTFFNTTQNNLQLDTNMLQIARKNLSAISLGYTNGDTSGTRILRRSNKKSAQNSRYKYNQLFEIKTIGKVAGHIRIGGFINEGVLYAAHYIKGADHGTTRLPFISILLQRQARFMDYQEI